MHDITITLILECNALHYTLLESALHYTLLESAYIFTHNSAI